MQNICLFFHNAIIVNENPSKSQLFSMLTNEEIICYTKVHNKYNKIKSGYYGDKISQWNKGYPRSRKAYF